MNLPMHHHIKEALFFIWRSGTMGMPLSHFRERFGGNEIAPSCIERIITTKRLAKREVLGGEECITINEARAYDFLTSFYQRESNENQMRFNRYIALTGASLVFVTCIDIILRFSNTPGLFGRMIFAGIGLVLGLSIVIILNSFKRKNSPPPFAI